MKNWNKVGKTPKKLKPKSAKGMKGLLLLGAEDTALFRVYDKKDKEKFTDYNIFINDLSITITDTDAFIKGSTENPIIDYSDRTLGVE